MMKWENPQIQGISLKETEFGQITPGILHCNHSAPTGAKLEVGVMECYFCPCCENEQFHVDEYGSEEAAKAAAQNHIDTVHPTGQCS